jgi:tetratricopeptide (TPR) repeat protein
MAIIPLRAYNREIEGMIDNRQLDEAVAHCRHILATYPKYIASYRLLGKALLEQQRISDATDVFQRILSSVPDDFIANVGMSIIREDENNLDSAIWHMELAYEAQPANAAIQDELRRLYGRRDGMQPPKVRLTRAALARMHAKGGLYDQAIAELRTAIAEDPNRPDLQLLLAEMFFQAGQRVEAVETCANIIKKIPFCLEANQILAVCLPQAEGSETARNYRQVVISIDPYYAFADLDALSSDQVPDNAVNIERLEYKSGIQAAETPPQPNWAASLGISIEKTADENIPDWLKSAEASAPGPSVESAPSSVSPFIWNTQEVKKDFADTSRPEAEIPEWMKDAGWQPASGEAPQPAEETKPEEPAPETPLDQPLEEAEIPEWLRGIAPEGVLGEEKQAEAPAESTLSTPWLEQQEPGPTDSIIHWLEDNKPEKPKSRPAREEAAAELSEDDVPDWLKDLEPSQPASVPPVEPAAPTPAFTIEPSAFIEETQPPEAPPTPVEPSEGSAEQGVEPPLEIKPAETEGAAAEAPAEVESTEAAEEEIPDWLKQLAGEQSLAEEEIPGQEVQPAETILAQPTEPVAEIPTAAEETAGVEFPIAGETPVAEESAPAEALPVAEIPEGVEEFPAPEAAALSEQPPAIEEPVISTELQELEALTSTEELPAEQATALPEQPPAIEEPVISAELQELEAPPSTEELPIEQASALSEQPSAVEEPVVSAELQEVEALEPTEELPAEQVTVMPEQPPMVEPSGVEEQALVEEGTPATQPLPAVETPAQAEEVLAEAAAQGEETPPLEQPEIAEQPPMAEAASMPEEITTGELPEEEQAAGLELPTSPPEEEKPEALAWLEDLAAEQSAKEESIPTPAEGGEISPPEWVKLEAEPPLDELVEPESVAPEAKPLPAEEIPDWIKGLGEEPETQPTPEEPTIPTVPEIEGAPPEELPAWLRELEEPESEKTEAAAESESLEWKTDEMPDWLKEIAETEASGQAVAPPEAQPVEERTPSELPTTVEAAIEEAAIEKEAAPSVTEPATQWSEEITPPAGIKREALEETPLEVGLQVSAIEEAEPPAPTIPEEAAPPVSEEKITPPVEFPAEQPDVSLDTFQAISQANQTTLSNARNALNLGEPSQAVPFYNDLIKQNYHLDEIIQDLHDALYRFPVDVDLWVTLGDVHFRLDDLPEALAAYTKAEELVR